MYLTKSLCFLCDVLNFIDFRKKSSGGGRTKSSAPPRTPNFEVRNQEFWGGQNSRVLGGAELPSIYCLKMIIFSIVLLKMIKLSSCFEFDNAMSGV